MQKDTAYLRDLGKRLAEIAALPIQQEKKNLWTASNDLTPVRPMVYMDQLPWHEINRSEEMTMRIEDPFLRSVEETVLRLIYRWEHFPCDMVVENRIDIPKTVHNLNYGIEIVDDVLYTDEKNDIVSHKYADQLETAEQVDALHLDEIWVDEQLDMEHLEMCSEIFHDIMPVRLSGEQIHSGIWDRIAQMRSVEKVLWDLVDRPEHITAIVKKFVDLTMDTVSRCEDLGILDAELQYVHCTGAYTKDIPAPDADLSKPKAKDCWSFGMSQIFATVSPAMHEEFEIDLVRPLYERFGLLYYGCCEPLDGKIDIIRKLKNVRKISISPWADSERGSEKIGKDYVLSLKANPAFIAVGAFEEEQIRNQIAVAASACKRNGTPLEIILKDVSTVSNRLEFLDMWYKVAMEYAMG